VQRLEKVDIGLNILQLLNAFIGGCLIYYARGKLFAGVGAGEEVRIQYYGVKSMTQEINAVPITAGLANT
jgi:hypothetical protein